MTRPSARRGSIRFPPFIFDPRTGELFKLERPVKLRPQPARVLKLLLEHAGEVVTRMEIQQSVWGESAHVDFDTALNTCIRQIRVALGDDPEAARYVETVPKVGYRFVARLESEIASSRLNGPTWALGLLILMVGAIGGLRWAVPASRSPSPAVRFNSPRRITSGAGIDDYPSWSPSGEMLAYHSDESGNYDIWMIHVDSGAATNLTVDSAYPDRFPNWSPDGSEILFYSERDGAGYFIVSIADRSVRQVGRLPRATPDEVPGTAQWSPDGSETAWLVASSNVQDPSIVIQSLDGEESRRLPVPGRTQTRLDLAWSPNGRFFAFVDAHSLYSDVASIWVLDVRDGTARPVVERQRNDRRPSWSADSRQLYFLSEHEGSTDLWRQRLDEDGKALGAPTAVTAGVGVRNAALSPDSRRLSYAKGREVANLWRLPIFDDRPARWEDAEQLTFDEAFAEHPDLSPDGREVAFSTDRRGGPRIWILRLRDRTLRPFTEKLYKSWGPRWSPDGKEIVFYSYRSGNRDIWVKPLSGAPARQLTKHQAEDMHPVWSPDGARIAFMSDRAGNWDVWMVPALGGQPVRITTDPAWESSPEWSPDGKWLAFGSGRLGEEALVEGPCLRRTGGPVRASNRSHPLSVAGRGQDFLRDFGRVGARQRAGNSSSGFIAHQPKGRPLERFVHRA